MANSNLDLGKIGKSLLQIICQTLGGCADSVYIHAVRAGTHDSAETARSEFKIAIERVYKLGFVRIVKHPLNLCAGFGIVAFAKPFLGLGNY